MNLCNNADSVKEKLRKQFVSYFLQISKSFIIVFSTNFAKMQNFAFSEI